MRNLKKFLALVLALMMAMSLMVTANAATSNVEYKEDGYTVNSAFEEAVTVLSGMGVIKGYDDGASFGPKKSITRAEAAALIYRLATGDVTDGSANLYATYGSFPDVTLDKWYAGYVGYCANYGIIKGRPDGTFDPSANVTGYEILAMILRAVGYDKNGEFSGGNWAYNVATLSTSLGVKRQVNSANYTEATFYQPASREVVASLLFETTATVPMVTYSDALKYMDTGMNGGLFQGTAKNPTLGEQNFGLTANWGIVVGNEETGEKAGTTKIGFDLDPRKQNSNDPVKGIDDTLSFVRQSGKVQSAYVYDSDTTNSSPQNVTLKFKWDSGLNYFGHLVKVWYDKNGNEVELAGSGANPLRFRSNLNTYAVFDKTNPDNVKVVSTVDTDGAASASADGTTGSLDLTEANPNKDDLVKKATFDTTYGVYWNYAFGPTANDDYATEPKAAGSSNWGTSDNTDFESPILKYDSTTQYPLYLVISNHPDGKADIVISLDMTITQITQVNNVFTDDKTVGVYNANSEDDITAGDGTNTFVRTEGNGYFDMADNHTTAYTTDTSTVYTEIAQANLVGKSTKTLGDRVVAIAITGTTGSNSGDSDTANSDQGNADDILNSTYYYKLSKMENVVPATVYTVDQKDGTVTLSDGSTMKRSPYANIVDASFATAASVVANPARYPQSNTTYTFTLDRDGRYIYFETTSDPGNFVYATYLDYVTALNSSTYKYSITYVNSKGEHRQVQEVTKWDTVDFSKFDINVGLDGYVGNNLPKRDSSQWGTVVPGRYIGYIMSGSTLKEVTTTGNIDGMTMNVGLGTFDNFDGAGNLNTDNSSKTSITPTDAVIGAKQVAGSDLFLTEDTTFYIVKGAGTDTQDVQTFHGLKALLEGNRSVVIDGGYAKDTSVIEKDWTSGGSPITLHYADMIYYTAKPFNYAQNYGFTYGTARAAQVVYLPADAVSVNKASSSSLYFVGDNTSSIFNAFGENAVQFTMYKDGKDAKVWVEGKLSDDTHKNSTNYGGGTSSSAGIILNEGKNVFYGLEDSGKKTNFGETIYKVVEAADPNSGTTAKNVDSILIGQYWNGTDVDISTNANLTTVGDQALYNATTNALQAAFIDKNAYITGTATELYNVTNAVVASANDNYTIKSLSDLHAAGSLYDNMGVPVSCVLNADSSRIVDFIYVNDAP